MKQKNLLLIAFMLVCTFTINAQSHPLAVENQYPNDERAAAIYANAFQTQNDTTATAVRTTWIANRPGDNWFISVNGGIAQLMSEETRYMDFKDQIKPTIGIAVGKWFSPVWGLRVSATAAELQGFATWTTTDGTGTGFGDWYTGKNYDNGYGNNRTNNYVAAYSAAGNDNAAGRQLIYDRFLKGGDRISTSKGDGYTYDFKYAGVSLDFLLNVKNLLTPYNSKAFFNPVLYAGVGYAHTFKDGDRTAVNSIMGKAGLQLNFRLHDRWDFFVDGQALVLPEIFDRRVGDGNTQDVVGNYTAGFTYRINFRHFIKAPLYDQSIIDALNDEINDLRNRPVVCPPVVVCPEIEEIEIIEEEPFVLTPVFFTLDSYVVRENQNISLAKAAEYLLENPGSKIQVTSYADINTGNPKYNMKLSENRSKAVVDALVSKFGIDRSRLEVKFYGDTVQPFDENDWNRVSIFVIP